MRAAITEILKPEQKQKYEEIIAESAGRPSGTSAGRGRVFVLDAGGAPRAVSVRTGLSDGSMTELVAGELKEGDQVIVGTAQAGAARRPRAGRVCRSERTGDRCEPHDPRTHKIRTPRRCQAPWLKR